jgi:hypothetical protein
MAIEIVASGTWVYGDSAESPVHIVRADFDFWYEIGAADGELERGERPDLNGDGVLYYVLFRHLNPDRFWPDDGSFRTIEDAQRAAQQRLPTTVRWQQ